MPTTLNTKAVPIHKLHNELLLEIFAENAYLFSRGSALYTTMLTTQVCHNWRALMLTTPLLWARLIDIDFLCERNMPADWLDEFFRRSGSTPLWIMTVGGPLKRYILLFDVLAAHWDRIENLVAQIDPSEWEPFSSEHWRWLYLPAPRLKTFNVEFGYKSWGIPKLSLAPLFAGSAPNLRYFKASHYPFDILTSLTWMHNLRSLFFSKPCTLREILTVLKMLPSLEELEIFYITMVSTLSTLPDLEESANAAIAAMGGFPNSPISLPNLHSLVLTVDFEACVFILERLDTPPDCSLQYFSYTQPHHLLDGLKFASAVCALSQFARRQFQSYTPTSLSLVVDNWSHNLTFRTATISADDAYSLVITGTDSPPLPEVLSTFSTAFALPEFAQATKLTFTLPEPIQTGSLAALFRCLTAIKMITTNEMGVAYISILDSEMCADGGGVVFPALKVLEIYSRSKEPAWVSALDAFVEARRVAGHPLEVRDSVFFTNTPLFGN